MHCADVARGARQGSAYLRIETLEGRPAGVWGHLDRAEVHTVEKASVEPKRIVAIGANGADDAGHRRAEIGGGRVLGARAGADTPPLEQRSALLRAEHFEGAVRSQSQRAHAINRSMRVTRIPSPPTALSALIVR